MRTIKNIIIKETVIKKSKFIAILDRFDDEKSLGSKIEYYENLYPNANHYCYAYIIGSRMHYSDDGEPAGTAGAAIYNVLEKNNLSNVLCIVIRYFGGIKLGASGLIRAYSNSSKAFTNNDLIELKEGIRIIITFVYDNTKMVDNIIKNAIKVNSLYDNDISYELLISNDDFNDIKDDITRHIKNINIKENVFITK